MTFWIGFLIYVAAGLLSARAFYLLGFQYDYEDSLRLNEAPTNRYNRISEEKMLDMARSHGLFCSIFAVTWPVTWIVAGIITFITRPTPIERELERKEKARIREEAIKAEMIRLRKWHENNKMEAPDTTTLRFMAEESIK